MTTKSVEEFFGMFARCYARTATTSDEFNCVLEVPINDI
jgi:hypothetical protein